MASDDPNAAGAQSRRPRTPPTLDLKAQELKSEPVAGTVADSATSTSAPESAGRAAPVDSPAPATTGGAATKSEGKPAAETKATDTKATSTKAPEAKPADTRASVPPTGTAAPKDAPKDTAKAAVKDDSKAEAKTGAAAAAPPAAPKGRSGAGTVLAALVLGLLGGAGAGGGLAYSLIHHQPPAPTVDLGPLTARMAALEGRPGADPQRLAALAGRLDQIDARLATADSALAALKDASAPPAASGPDLTPQMDALKSAVGKAETALGALDARVTALKGAEEALQAGQESLKTAVAAATVAAQQAQGLGPRIDLMGARIDEARKEALNAADAAAATNRAAASLVVLGSLKAALETGRPFAPELAAAQALLGPRAAALEPFAGQAEGGFPTLAKLADTLAATGNASLDALTPAPEAAPADASLMTRFLSSAQTLVKIRPADGPDVDAARTTLGRAVVAVRTGDLAGALSLLRQMPPAVSAKLAPIVAQMDLRLRALDAAAALYQQSLASISGKAP
ncbi:hypothetical protein [Xanthobacter sp. ZOL 2024]